MNGIDLICVRASAKRMLGRGFFYVDLIFGIANNLGFLAEFGIIIRSLSYPQN